MKRAVIVLNTAVLLIIFSFYGCSIADQTNSGLESDPSTTIPPGATTHIPQLPYHLGQQHTLLR